MIASVLMISALPGVASAADPLDAVTTPGSGALTMCRNWVVYNSCDTHKVPVPQQVTVGDKIKFTYGSNPKDYIFHVVHIRQQGDSCTILSDVSAGREDGEKLEITPCQPSENPTAGAR